MKDFYSLVLEVLSITIPIFVVVAVGYFIRRKGVVTEKAVHGLNKIAYNIALPALIFITITRHSLAEIFNPGLIKVIYSTYAIYIFLVFLFVNFTRTSNKFKGAFIVSSFRCNMAFIGFPIVLSAYGGLALAKASLVVAFLVPVNIIASILIFRLYSKGEGKIIVKKMLLGFLVDPLILSAILGIIVSYLNFNFPQPVFKVLDILSGMAIGIALIAIGASFRFFHLKANIKALSIISFLKLILLPLIALAISTFVFKLDIIDRNLIVILFSMPLAVVAFIMGKEYRSDFNFISSTLITTTIFSSITISGWLLILKII